MKLELARHAVVALLALPLVSPAWAGGPSLFVDDDTVFEFTELGPVLVLDGWEVDDDGKGASVGDGDGFLEASETAELTLQITNVGDLNASNVAVTLFSPDPDAISVDGPVLIGDIKVGATLDTTGSPTPRLRLDVGCVEDKIVSIDVRIDDSSGVSHLDVAQVPVYCIRDADEDGYLNTEDCDDGDPAIHPGADERCNDLDDNCNGLIDDDPVDMVQWFLDADDDTWGTAIAYHLGCPDDPQTDHVLRDGDCDDGDPALNPDATEVCNDIDDDCNDLVDDDALDALTYYADSDDDGYGDPDNPADACDPPGGYVTNVEDCDDSSATTHPGADEYCNGDDDDCDGEIDDFAVDAAVFYIDADGDGYGDASTVVAGCEPGTGYADNADDCDDSDASVYPGALGWTEDCLPVEEEPTDAGSAAPGGCGCSAGTPPHGWWTLLPLLALGRRRSA